MKTYHDWNEAGRAVRIGTKAEHYLVSPDRTQSIALFREDQTVERDRAYKTWTEVVSAEERPDKNQSLARPKVKVDYDTETKMMGIWVGSNKKAIANMKISQLTYEPRSHRWVGHRDDITAVVRQLESNGNAVELTIDEHC